MIPKFQIVEVEWLDAQTGFSAPIGMDELDDVKPLETHSVGYLMKEDKEGITLGFMLFDKQQSFKHWQFIPKGMIKKIVKLKK
ncbi:MAG: hypothetical protein ACTSQ4_02300 [Candidatus Heimdallarchaeaceae archaeon]